MSAQEEMPGECPRKNVTAQGYPWSILSPNIITPTNMFNANNFWLHSIVIKPRFVGEI